MRKKEFWMEIGQFVYALGKKGKLIDFHHNTIDGVEYVYQMQVEVDGMVKHYHPNDLKKDWECPNQFCEGGYIDWGYGEKARCHDCQENEDMEEDNE